MDPRYTDLFQNRDIFRLPLIKVSLCIRHAKGAELSAGGYAQPRWRTARAEYSHHSYRAGMSQMREQGTTREYCIIEVRGYEKYRGTGVLEPAHQSSQPVSCQRPLSLTRVFTP